VVLKVAMFNVCKVCKASCINISASKQRLEMHCRKHKHIGVSRDDTEQGDSYLKMLAVPSIITWCYTQKTLERAEILTRIII
jgi:hypothetical protein